MKIGIIGSGNIGGNLGKHWSKAGHQVLFSSRHPNELNSLVKEAGENAQAVSVAQAFEANADVYLLAMPFKAIDEIAELYAGEYGNKIIIDATNPYPERDGEMAEKVREANYNASEYTAMKFGTAKTVKAFNSIHAEHLRDRAFRNVNKLTVPFAAQDQESRAVGKQLIEDIGFDALYIGDLSDTNIMDPDQAIYGKSLEKKELETLVNTTRKS
ncbi:NAD(P)-binding domain-containing protein [Mariniflexile litorale]|uniref:NAD(P)-binding domain-containing protein n=1 Tax=Mariniflexile litorale TaxID=3045158 RepID=A0AAU7EG54_9FLAO|nr:NAD(P)-binding domain-containing protein [Mariniflexile sp. KMM 9835]MDQ8211886.1 NAD(P)-binding domain-containing protein [Mariniflexile sp. KMM 9835]